MKHYTAAEVFKKAIEFAHPYDVQVQLIQVFGKEQWRIGRDEESGQITFFLSDKTPQDVAAFYIMVAFLDVYTRQWLYMDDEAAMTLKRCVSRIIRNHKKDGTT